MPHEEQRLWLINYLLKENDRYTGYAIPDDPRQQKDLLRALMNVRMPEAVSEEFLQIQDAYLWQETVNKGIVDVDSLCPCEKDERIYLWQGDMTRLKAEVVVNPANEELLGCFIPLHNCLDNLIHSGAGVQLRLDCYEIMQQQGHPEATGQAKITKGYNLPCDYVIHTVGPIVQGPLTQLHQQQLASCYRSCLTLAEEKGIKSIAFSCISTGVFSFPNEEAGKIAVETVCDYLKEHHTIEKVVFNVFKDIDLEIYDKLLNQ